MNYYIATDRFGQYDLKHYGIKGQKWGIRRFQDESGKLTKEGISRYREFRKEISAENRKAFRLGRDATIAGRALEKAQKKYDNSKIKNEEKVRAVLKDAQKKYKRALSDGKKHYDELVEKYGSDSVKDIKFGKNGKVSERILSGRQIAATTLLAMAGVPIGFLTGGLGGLVANATFNLWMTEGALNAIAISSGAIGGLRGATHGKRVANRAVRRSYKESKKNYRTGIRRDNQNTHND